MDYRVNLKDLQLLYADGKIAEMDDDNKIKTANLGPQKATRSLITFIIFI